jgi:hypothetical protein
MRTSCAKSSRRSASTSAGRWIFEPEILDRFTKPDMNLEEIDEGEARAISG